MHFYAISKFATEGMMQILADELEGTDIRVNAINPGGTQTRMRKSVPRWRCEQVKNATRHHPAVSTLNEPKCDRH